MTNKIGKPFQEQFLDELLVEAGFEKTDNLDLLKEDLRPLLQERIMMHIYQELNDEQVNNVTKLLDEDKIDEVDTYVRNIIEDFDDFLMEIYTQFEDEYLENMEETTPEEK